MKKTKRVLALFLAAALAIPSGVQGAEAAGSRKDGPLRIWFDEPVSEGSLILSAGAFSPTEEDNRWQQFSLPIGNSYMGANVYGEIETEHLTFNQKTLWNGGPSEARPDYDGGNIFTDAQGTPMSEIMEEINQLFLAGEDEEASELCNKLIGEYGCGAYQSWGDIYLNFSGISKEDAQEYTRDLDLETAVANVDFLANQTEYHREYFISYEDQVLAMKLTANGKEHMNFSVSFPVDNAENVTSRKLGKEVSYETTDDTIVMQGEMQDNQMKMNSMLKVIPVGGSVKKGADGESLEISDADEVVIFVAADTDYENKYPEYRTGESHQELAADVAAVVEAAVSKTYEEVKEAHIRDYREIFDRVELDLGQGVTEKTTDQLLAAYKDGTATGEEKALLEVLQYQFGRFLAIESSRAGDLPANLQGVWQNRVGDENRVPWSSDYHFNVNMQMNYWPVYAANMAECAEPLIDYVNSLREPGRVTAEAYFGIKSEEGEENGFSVHTQNTPFGWTCPGWNFSWGWSPAALPWILQNCWEHYEYTQDAEYMKEHIYPMLKEEAKMYAGLLIDSKTEITLEDGTKSTRLVSSPAYSPEHGPRTLGNVYEQSLIWQLFEDTIRAMEIVGNPADYGLMEELKEKQARLAPIEIGESGQIKEWYHETTLGSVEYAENGHRHMSHLLGLYPGDLISVDNDEYMDAAIVSLNNRGIQSVGWGISQRMTSWARMGDGEKAHELMQMQFRTGIYPNLWVCGPPFQIDGNFGYVAGMNEMLIQSNMGYINILPAVPDVWQSGSVKGLVARGNFETDIRWENGKAQEVTIDSRSGGDCSVQYAGINQAIVKDADGNPVEAQILGRDRITFPTSKGESYTITEFPEIMDGPSGLEAVYYGEEGVELAWDPAEGVGITYNIYRKIENNYEKLNQNPVTEPCYLDTQTYETLSQVKYKVTAVGDDGSESLDSETVKVNDLTLKGMVDDNSSRIVYSPGWNTWNEAGHYGGGIHYKEATGPNDSISMDFVGSGIRIIATKNRERGIMDVYIDNVKTDSIDFYIDGNPKQQLVYENTSLPEGRHTIRLVGTGTKNPASTGTKMEFDAFQVLGKSYTVSFESDLSGTGQLPQEITEFEGGVFNLPECALTVKGHSFAGWNDGKKTYKAGAIYFVPKGGSTLKAVWEKTDGIRIPSSQLSAIADSEHGVGTDGPAAWAVDGDETTLWCSNYGDGVRPDIPNNKNNSITINLGGLYQVNKLEYLTRTQANGRILGYQLRYSTSEEGDDFQPVEGGTGEWANNAKKKTVSFSPVNARRIQIRATKTAADGADNVDTFITALEFYLYHTGESVAEPIKAAGVSLEPEKLELKPGETEVLKAEVIPENATNKQIIWKSSNEKAVMVEEGTVTAMEVGTAVITATSQDGGFEAKCVVEVTPVQPEIIEVRGIEVSPGTAVLKKAGETIQIKAAILPENATNQGVSWSSSNKNVASVDETGKVTAHISGSTVITAISEDGGYIAECLVTVRIPISVTGITINQEKAELKKIGETLRLYAAVTPANADNKKVNWISANPKVVQVSADGTIRAVSAGQAAVQCRSEDGNYTDQCIVSVNPLPDQVRIQKISKAKTSSVKVTWHPVSGAVNYRVEIFRKGKWMDAGLTGKNYKTISGLAAGTAYKVRVSACSAGGWGPASNVTEAVTAPEKVKIKGIKKVGKNSLKVTYKKVKCTGYQVCIKAGSKPYKKVNTKKTYLLKEKLKSGRKYTFKVRAYVKNGKQTIYGKYSSAGKKVL